MCSSIWLDYCTRKQIATECYCHVQSIYEFKHFKLAEARMYMHHEAESNEAGCSKINSTCRDQKYMYTLC